MTIRPATTDDIPAIRAMAEVAFPATYREILTPAQIGYMMEMMYSEQSLLRQMTEEKNVFFICEGRGYVSYRYAGLAGDGVDLYHLEKLYVMPDCQGCGLGRRLVDTIFAAARQTSAGRTVRVELNVNRYNRAVSFYEHIGMRRASQGDFPIGEGFYMNDYIMAIDLL